MIIVIKLRKETLKIDAKLRWIISNLLVSVVIIFQRGEAYSNAGITKETRTNNERSKVEKE
jgi:hypothetical protein